jgi:hypothetical protein
MAQIKYIGEGNAQIGTKTDQETTGAFFAKFEPGDSVPIPDKLAVDIELNETAWEARGFVLVR